VPLSAKASLMDLRAAAPARSGDRAFGGLVGFFGLGVLAMPALMVAALVHASGASLRGSGLSLFTGARWDPAHDHLGALPLVYGTLASSLLALCLAVPVSMGLAVYLSDLAPAGARKPLGSVVELFAAIPSVVYGFWGVAV